MRDRDTGILLFDEKHATDGFTLIVPLVSKEAYLVGMRGEVLHLWNFPLTPGNYAYLLPNGNLLASVRAPGIESDDREGLRLIQEVEWRGQIIWQCEAPAQHQTLIHI